jgi:hypothetical protein
MNSRLVTLSAATLAAVALCAPQAARASLSLNAVLQSIYQIGNGSTAVSLGHTVVAGTNLNRLIAGGSYLASCVSPYTGTIPGERTLPSSLTAQYNQLYVTIPAQLPAVRNMPGFENVPAGSILSCSYNWTAFAKESTYSVGPPGIGITVGGEEKSLGDTIGFQMYKMTDGEEPSRGCMH